MAQKSGFFNSLLVNGEYDRTINANDFRNYMAAVVSTGVRRSYLNDLRVTAAGGMALTIGAGFAVIEGAYFINDSAFNSFTVPTAPTGDYSRVDRVVIQLNDSVSVRAAQFVYKQGTPAASPVAPALVRSGDIYEIALADILVAPMVTEIQQREITDQRPNAELCGWVSTPLGYEDLIAKIDNDIDEWFAEKRDKLASVTLIKRYPWNTTLTAAASSVTFDIPQYEAGSTSIIDVFVNGNIEIEGEDFTINGNTITFAGTKAAGTEINVFCWKSIDGTGLKSVSDEVTALQNKVATLEGAATYTYKCTGADDNKSLSQIAQAFYNGSYDADDITPAALAFLESIGGAARVAAFGSRTQMIVRVVGTCGVSSPYSGDGSETSRYKWFNIGAASRSEKRLILDFAYCDQIEVPLSGATGNIVFFGTDLFIKNASVKAVGTANGCSCIMTDGAQNNGEAHFENCRFYVETTGKAQIAVNGCFRDCDGVVISTKNHALAFSPESTSLIRLDGGRYVAYATGTYIAAVIYIYANRTDGVVYANGVNCPVIAKSGYNQTLLAGGFAGKALMFGMISTLPKDGETVVDSNRINFNKP